MNTKHTRTVGLIAIVTMLLLVTAGVPADDPDSTVLLSRIKFVINGEMYSWDGTEPYPTVPEGASEIAVLLSYTGLQPGTEYPAHAIAQQAKAWQLRMDAEGFFYQSNVTVVPPNRYPDRRTLLVTIEDGFRQGYGGGPIYAYWTARNIAGRGRSVAVTAGLNVAHVEWTDRALGGRRLSGTLRGGYTNWGVVFDDPAYHRVTGGGQLGYRLTPDLEVYGGADLFTQILSETAKSAGGWGEDGRTDVRPLSGASLLYIAEPRESLRLTTFANAIGGMLLSLTTDTRPVPVASGAIGTRLTAGRTRARITGAGLWSARGVPHLYETDLTLDETTIVRSGWDPELLRSESLLWLSAELGRDTVTLGRAFPATLRPFLFTDHAVLNDLEFDRSSGDTRYVDAYGTGFKLVFGNPVNATFELSTGINHDGDYRVVFRQEFTL
jgi:hypothetical protein